MFGSVTERTRTWHFLRMVLYFAESALEREKRQEKPSYEELCRRFLADQEDFSEAKLREAGIPAEARFENRELTECADRIEAYIRNRIPLPR